MMEIYYILYQEMSIPICKEIMGVTHGMIVLHAEDWGCYNMIKCKRIILLSMIIYIFSRQRQRGNIMSVNQRLVNPLTDKLFDIILQLESREECYEFFEDLCTINELRDMSQRLEVARMLQQGEKYDKIEESTGASTATISRVKRALKYGADGYIHMLEREAGLKEEK